VEDYLSLDEHLSSEEKMIRDSVRRYVDNEALPLIPDAFEKGEFPEKIIKDVANLGLLGIYLPSAYGGADASATVYGLVCQELERGDSGLRSFVSVQSSLCMYPIFRFGNEEQRQRYLPAMARGEIIGCFGLTEPDSGSDPGSMTTTAKAVDGGWLLNGSKMWITNAPIADIAIVWAKTTDGIRAFIVEKEREGFKRIKIEKKLSLRFSSTGELAFSDCFIPEENLLPGSSKGLGAALACLTQARFGVAWGAMGAAMACYETALDYTKERKQFDKPLASFQLIQKDLVDIAVEIIKTQCFNLQLARLKEKDQLHPALVSMGKMNACRVALEISRKTRNLLGANGISLEYPIIRHMNNLESVYTYEGTDNIHHLIIGRYLTGLDAFK